MIEKKQDALDSLPSVLLQREIDRMLASLGNHHRRKILLLVKHDAVEHEADVLIHNRSDSESAEVRLRHIHLPKLVGEGYIDWDPSTGEISKGPRFDEIEPSLDLLENHADELLPDWR